MELPAIEEQPQETIKIVRTLPLANREIKSKGTDEPNYNPLLPKPYFRGLAIGSSGCGKTNAILNMLKAQQKFLTKIFVISISVFNDPKQKDTFEAMDNCVVFQTPDDDTLKTILKEVQRLNKEWEKYKHVIKAWEKFKSHDYDESCLEPNELMDLYLCDFNPENMEITTPPNYFLLVDDAAGTPLVKSKYFQSVVIRLRHWKTNIMITTQNYKLINNTYRRNCSFFMIYRIPDINQLKDIFNEISIFFDDFAHFQYIYNNAIKERHDFIYIDVNDRDNPVRRNFNEVLQVRLK